MNKNVIQLGSYRELLAHWDAIRERIISGQIKGIHTTMLEADESEKVMAAGVYGRDPMRAVSAILNASAVRILGQDDPPLFQASML